MKATNNNFLVKDNKGNVVFEGIGGKATAWAEKNVWTYGDLFVHYYGKNTTVLHYYVGTVTELFWGNPHKGVCTEYVKKVA